MPPNDDISFAVDHHTHFINKLPHITAAFWFMKITATTLGETGGDWLSMSMNFGYLASTLIFIALFVGALGSQLLAQTHHPYLYWTVIIATSTAGTTMSDYMDRTLGLGYATGALLLVSMVVGLLVLWRISVGNVRVNDIRTRKAEVFYWVTILFSNTLGTALGDFLADDSGLGFLGGWLVITSMLGIILLLFLFTELSKVVLFWSAFILTRPFGATFGDLLTKMPDQGGVGCGRSYTSLLLLVTLLASIVVSYRSNKRA